MKLGKKKPKPRRRTLTPDDKSGEQCLPRELIHWNGGDASLVMGVDVRRAAVGGRRYLKNMGFDKESLLLLRRGSRTGSQ